jgi:hypothetical protein
VEQDAATAKLLADIAAAKIAHGEFLAKEAIEKPERDRKLAEWRAEKKARERDKRTNPEGRAMGAARMRKWRAADPERARASYQRDYEKRKLKKQISTDLLQAEDSK